MKVFIFIAVICSSISLGYTQLTFGELLENIDQQLDDNLQDFIDNDSFNQDLLNENVINGDLLTNIDNFNNLKCLNCQHESSDGINCAIEICDNNAWYNGTSCASITYNVLGITTTYRGCYYKMPQNTGSLNFGLNGLDVQATYKTCDNDLCNGSESLKNSFSVMVITFILFMFSHFC